MPRYTIEVEFSGNAQFEIEADSEDEALEKAQHTDWVENHGNFDHVDWDVSPNKEIT